MTGATQHDWAALMPAAGAERPVKHSYPLGIVLLYLLLGGAMGAVAATQTRGGDIGSIAGMVIGLGLSGWLHLLIHEAGHALAGLSRGMQMIAAGAGPFRLERSPQGWRWHKAWNVAGIGGFAALAPTAGRAFARVDQAIFLLGGVLANLLAAMLALLLWGVLEASWADSALIAFATIGLLIAGVNLLPFRSGGWATDGLALLHLWTRPRDAALQLQLSQVVSLSLAGVRARDWPVAMVPAPAADSDPSVAMGATAMRLSWALDSRTWDDADACARTLASQHAAAPDGKRQGIALMLAAYAALRARSAALLAAWLPLSERSLLDHAAQRAWLRAELAALQGDPATARAELQSARLALARVHDAASAQVIAEHLQALQGRLDAN